MRSGMRGTNRRSGLTTRSTSGSEVCRAALATAEPPERRTLFSSVLYWDPGQTPTANGGRGSGGTGGWDASTANWSNGTSDVVWNNANGDTASFGAGAGGTVALGAPVTAGSISFTGVSYGIATSGSNTLAMAAGASDTVTVASGATATISAAITGAVGLTKAGSGTLVLNGISTYSGGTVVSAGTLCLGNAGATGAVGGALTVNAGSLDLNGNSLSVGSLAGTGGTILDNGGGNSVLTVSGGNTTYTGVLTDHTSGTGTLGLATTGSAKITFKGANTYSGATTIGVGSWVQLGSGTTTGTLGTGPVVDNGTLYLSGAGATAVANAISGTGAVIQFGGSGITTLTGSNSYAGGTTVSAGTLVANPANLGTGPTTVLPQATLTSAASGLLPLTDNGIGSPTITGRATLAGGALSVTGAGTGIGGTSDQYNFADEPFVGDGSITAEVTQTATNADGSAGASAQAGVMFRDPNFANAPFVDVVYANGVGLQMTYREGNGQAAQQVGNNVPVSGPFWVRRSRDGFDYTGSYSTDGSTWTALGTTSDDTVSYSALAGLAVCSHDATRAATATFADVSTFAVDVTSPTEADVALSNPWSTTSDTILYGSADGGKTFSQLADVPAGQQMADVTGLTPQVAYALVATDASSGAVPTGTGGSSSGMSSSADTTTAMNLYVVSAPPNLTQGISGDSDQGQVVVQNPLVWAKDELTAAEKAQVGIAGYQSKQPNGTITYKPFGVKVTKASDTGHTSPFNEQSLNEAFGMADDTAVVAVEDSTDNDYNDAFAVLTELEVDPQVATVKDNTTNGFLTNDRKTSPGAYIPLITTTGITTGRLT